MSTLDGYNFKPNDFLALCVEANDIVLRSRLSVVDTVYPGLTVTGLFNSLEDVLVLTLRIEFLNAQGRYD